MVLHQSFNKTQQILNLLKTGRAIMRCAGIKKFLNQGIHIITIQLSLMLIYQTLFTIHFM